MRRLNRDLLRRDADQRGNVAVSPEPDDVAAIVDAARSAFLDGGPANMRKTPSR